MQKLLTQSFRKFLHAIGTEKMENNIYEDPDGSPLCVVRLFNLLRAMKPHFLRAIGTPLFTLTSGLVIHRDLIESTLRAAADRLDLPTGMFSTHSLRAGAGRRSCSNTGTLRCAVEQSSGTYQPEKGLPTLVLGVEEIHGDAVEADHFTLH